MKITFLSPITALFIKDDMMTAQDNMQLKKGPTNETCLGGPFFNLREVSIEIRQLLHLGKW